MAVPPLVCVSMVETGEILLPIILAEQILWTRGEHVI